MQSNGRAAIKPDMAGFLRRFPAHPMLFGLFPVLTLYLHNIEQVTTDDLLLSAAAALLVGLIVHLLARLSIKSSSRAAVLASVVVLLFFAYGHFRIALKSVWPRQSDMSGSLLLVLVSGGMVLAWFLVRRSRRSLDTASKAMNIISLVMVLYLCALIAFREYGMRGGSSPTRAAPGTGYEEPAPGSDRQNELPDIYFLVMDRYPRHDVAMDIYRFDNRPFLTFLEERGFFVAESSVCNYARTDMSLASCLNVKYLERDSAAPGSLNRRLYDQIQEGWVWRRLKQAGYRTHHLGTWWRPTRANRSADVNVNYGLLSEFAMEFYKTTLLYPVGALLGLDSHREQWVREQLKFDYLDTLTPFRQPVFVFAHFLLPHDPYVFSRSGSYQSRLKQAEVGIDSGFVGQLEYANSRLSRWVTRVLQDSGRSSVIVIAADEGPRPGENFAAAGELRSLRARFGIITAYHFPGADRSMLYHGISLVNAFRVVFSRVLGDDLPLLADRSFDCAREYCIEVTDDLCKEDGR